MYTVHQLLIIGPQLYLLSLLNRKQRFLFLLKLFQLVPQFAVILIVEKSRQNQQRVKYLIDDYQFVNHKQDVLLNGLEVARF